MPWRQALMDEAADLVAAERRDHALDLPPMAEARDIAVVAAALGPGRGLEPGIVTKTLDQVRRVRERDAAMDEYAVHEAF